MIWINHLRNQFVRHQAHFFGSQTPYLVLGYQSPELPHLWGGGGNTPIMRKDSKPQGQDKLGLCSKSVSRAASRITITVVQARSQRYVLYRGILVGEPGRKEWLVLGRPLSFSSFGRGPGKARHAQEFSAGRATVLKRYAPVRWWWYPIHC